ncbi:MAG: ComF family protein [Anaerolineae bacterium]
MRVLAAPLADLLFTTFQMHGISCDLIIPVPLHRARLRERGYNQSVLLAVGLAERTGIPAMESALLRTKNTPAQVGLSREQRHQNMHGAFRSMQSLNGRNILLIDDVCTTGATLEACAEVLVASGAHSVQALTLARAIGRYQTLLQ